MKRYPKVLIALMVLGGVLASSSAFAQKRRMRTYKVAVEKKMNSMMKEGWSCVTNLSQSPDGKEREQDLELRFTMPIDDFMKEVPKFILEAAGIPHKFGTVNIYVRHEDTDRIGRIAFADARPIAGRYKAGDVDAVDEMADSIIWH